MSRRMDSSHAEEAAPAECEDAGGASAVDVVKISSIRSAIDAKLHEEGVYEQIRELILSKAPRDGGNAGQPEGEESTVEKTQEGLIREVLQSELVQQLLETIRLEKAAKSDTRIDTDDDGDHDDATRSNEPALFVRVAGGRAFVDQLVQEEEVGDDGVERITDHQVGHVQQFFRLVVSFQGQRLVSKDVACAVDPAFNEHFKLQITKKRTRTGRTKNGGLYEVDVVAPWEALCLVDEPLHVAMIKVTKRVASFQHATGAVWKELKRELVATHRLDWRRVLCSTLQLVHMPVQLVDKMKVPVGTLDLRLDVLHFQRTSAISKDVTAFLNKEALERNTQNHAFYRYAKEWWNEYKNEMEAFEANVRRERGEDTIGLLLGDVRVHQRSRLVKLFAEDDEGRFRMVCKFLTALRVPLALRSPREAARFVSLLPHESTALVGGLADEAWRSVATTLAVGKGDTQDHAVLLASLLLGCGLDAYVCIGMVSSKRRLARELESQRLKATGNSEVGHVWVLTRDPDRAGHSDGVLFWESLTGECYSVRDRQSQGGSQSEASRHGYISIDCVFSAKRFYANLQPRQWRLSDYSFQFDDEAAWKALDPRRIADLPSPSTTVTLSLPDSSGALTMEVQWTSHLRRAIGSVRRSKGLVTKWSDELSFYLQPALNSYELERLYNVPQVENDLFQQTIKRFVKEGFTFQAVPLMIKSPCPEDAMESLETNAVATKMLHIQGKAAQFGHAVRCFAYPEGLFVSWVMLAVSYQS